MQHIAGLFFFRRLYPSTPYPTNFPWIFPKKTFQPFLVSYLRKLTEREKAKPKAKKPHSFEVNNGGLGTGSDSNGAVRAANARALVSDSWQKQSC